MNKIDILLTLLKESVQKCYSEPDSLIQRSHRMERSIVARIYYYMQTLINTDNRFVSFREFNLDSEYNRNMDDLKRTEHYKNGTSPDIILHKRETNQFNIMVIEFKPDGNDNIEDIEKDKKKLIDFTNPQGEYKYFIGIFVKLNRDTPEYTYFQNGEEISDMGLINE